MHGAGNAENGAADLKTDLGVKPRSQSLHGISHVKPKCLPPIPPRDATAIAQLHSPNFSLCLLCFLIREEEHGCCPRKRNPLVSSAGAGFAFSFLCHSWDQGKLLLSKEAVSLHGRIFKALFCGQLLLVMVAFCSNIKHMSASSHTAQEHSATQGLKKFLRNKKTPGAVQVQNYNLPLLVTGLHQAFSLGSGIRPL